MARSKGEPAFLAPGQAWEHSRSAVQRKEQGQWPTPWWVVERSLDVVLNGLPDAPVILDPACGDGRWLAAVGLRIPNARLIGWDLDPEALAAAESVLAGAGVQAELVCRDALAGQARPVADLVVGNPPYIRPQNLPREKRHGCRGPSLQNQPNLNTERSPDWSTTEPLIKHTNNFQCI